MKNEKGQTVCIVGAGPGGYACAFRAADLGLKVTLVDRTGRLGGTCLHHGCIPSKALVHLARAIREAQDVAEAGVHFAPPTVDLEAVRRFVRGVVHSLSRGLTTLAKGRSVEFIEGEGRLRGPREVVIASGSETVCRSFDAVVWATGSEPVLPEGVSVGERIWDSSRALEIPFMPARLLVMGGGYIGLEMAFIYSALGSRVTVAEVMPRILPGMDPDLIRPVQRRASERLERIRTGVKVEIVGERRDEVEVVFRSDGQEQRESFEAVLIAVGRRPNTTGCGLEEAGAQVDEQGRLVTEGVRVAGVPWLLALGDITRGPMLAHRATDDGYRAAELLGGVDRKEEQEDRVIPYVVFSDPEIAWCGVNESEARERGMEVKRSVFRWSALGRAVAEGRADGLTKLVIEAGSGRVVGAGAVGVNAGELIGEAAVAIEAGLTVEEWARVVHAHPTLGESFEEAARAAAGIPIHSLRSSG